MECIVGGYRLMVIKSKISNINNDTIMKSIETKFFDDTCIFFKQERTQDY